MSQNLIALERVYREDTLSAYRRSVELAITTMRNRFGEPLTVDDLAHAAFMSRCHFIRAFAKITGVSPGRFLAAIRIQEAKRLLLRTDRSVTDISLQVGYNSLGTFTRIFSNCVGLPPIHFRQLALAFRSLPFSAMTNLIGSQHVSANASIIGQVQCRESFAVAIVGLFRNRIPSSQPLACAILHRTTRFGFNLTSSGYLCICAAGMLPGSTVEDAMLAIPLQIRVGSAVVASPERQSREVVVELQEMQFTQPPMVFAFPLLVAESLLAKQLGNLGEAEPPELCYHI